jgi:preprotein translocase, SecE subunit, bacterial
MAVENKVKSEKKAKNQFLVKFFREIKAESSRITWPTKKDVKKASIAVGVLCLIYILYVGVVDYAFQNLFKWIYKI